MTTDTSLGQNGPQRTAERLQRAFLAGATVGGIAIGVVLAFAVAVRVIELLLGWLLFGGIIVFGLGVGLATAAVDWFVE